MDPHDPVLAKLKGVGLRCLAYDLDELWNWLAQLPQDTPVFVSVNNECRQVGGDWRGWDAACGRLASDVVVARSGGRVVAVGAGVELDIWYMQPPGGSPDPRLTPLFAADLANRAYRVFEHTPVQLVATSVASGLWQDYLGQMAPLLRSGIAVDLHPYVSKIGGLPPHGEPWEELSGKITRAKALVPGRTLYISEGGIKVGDAGGLNAQAEYVRRWLTALWDRVPFGAYFCLYDNTGTTEEQGDQAFGLVDAQGRPRPAFQAFRETVAALLGESLEEEDVPPPPPGPEFILGIKAEAERLRAKGIDVGTPLEHEVYPYQDSPYSYQTTTRGKFEYSRAAKVAHFYKAEGR